MINTKDAISTATELRQLAPGMRRAEMKLIASDYTNAANLIEELVALCDEKDATIDEIRSQLETGAWENIYANNQTSERLKCASLYDAEASKVKLSSHQETKGLDHPHAPVNDGVVRGPVSDEEVSSFRHFWFRDAKDADQETIRRSLEQLLIRRGLL